MLCLKCNNSYNINKFYKCFNKEECNSLICINCITNNNLLCIECDNIFNWMCTSVNCNICKTTLCYICEIENNNNIKIILDVILCEICIYNINKKIKKFQNLWKKYKKNKILWQIAEYYSAKKYSPLNILKYIDLT